MKVAIEIADGFVVVGVWLPEVVRAHSEGTCARGSALTPKAMCNHSLTYLELMWLLKTTLLLANNSF